MVVVVGVRLMMLNELVLALVEQKLEQRNDQRQNQTADQDEEDAGYVFQRQLIARRFLLVGWVALRVLEPPFVVELGERATFNQRQYGQIDLDPIVCVWARLYVCRFENGRKEMKFVKNLQLYRAIQNGRFHFAAHQQGSKALASETSSNKLALLSNKNHRRTFEL